MNRRLLVLTIFFYHTSLYLMAQRKSYQAKDGTSVDVEVISTNPDEGRNACIFLGLFGPEGVNTLGVNYYRPGAFFINGMVDLVSQSSANLDASIFFTSKIKKVTMSQSVKASGNTKYVVKIPGEKRKSLGLHVGANAIDYSTLGEGNHSTIGLFTGLSILKARHTHWKIYDRYQQAQGTIISRFNADVIYYAKRKLESGYVDQGGESLNDLTRQVGFRVYFDGKATLWSRQGRLSINYMLGVGLNSNRSSLPFFAGFGIGYNFL